MAPAAVVKAYSAAVNAGDFDAIFALYADDAVVRSPAGLFVGKAAIGTWLQGAGEATAETLKDVQANGTTVIATGTVSLTRFKALGIDAVEFRAERIVENGKIRFFTTSVVLTPEQRAKVMAAMPPAPSLAVDPVAVVKDYIATANTGDFEKTLAFFADDAVVRTPVGLFVGKEAIRKWLQEDVQGTRATPNEFQVINGGTTVINTGMVSTARFRAVGIDQSAYRSDYLITGDKISYFSPTPMLTPEQQAKVRAAGPPSAALPTTGGTASTATLWLLALAGLMLVLGFALQHTRIRTR
jgi:ketosteroid isomerase-like protein